MTATPTRLRSSMVRSMVSAASAVSPANADEVSPSATARSMAGVCRRRYRRFSMASAPRGGSSRITTRRAASDRGAIIACRSGRRTSAGTASDPGSSCSDRLRIPISRGPTVAATPGKPSMSDCARTSRSSERPTPPPLMTSTVGDTIPGAKPSAARAAALGFAPGIVSPTVLVMRGGGVGRSLERLVLAQSLIERFPGVAATVGPREIGILSRSLQELPGSEAVPADVLRPLRQAMIAPRSDAARLVVILDDPPLGAEAIENLRYLRRQTPAILRAVALGDTSSAFAGDTALAADTIDRTIDDLRRVGVAVILVSLLTLVLFLRSLVAPVYLVIASVLGFLASLGLTVTVFQSWLDQGSLSFLVPFASGVLLVSLGSDYTIFLAGQIWAEARTTSFRRAVAQATPRASGPITVAGVTLASSFAMLALVPLAAFRQIAFALAAGVLIDTFIVRSFLVPALIALGGRASGWPSRSVGRNEE